MIAVLVRDKDGVQALRIFADGRKSRKSLTPAQSAVDKNTGVLGTDKGAVARAAAGEHANFENTGLLLAALLPIVLRCQRTTVGTKSAYRYNGTLMLVRVFVSLKSTVLDPQGQAIQAALRSHGHPAVADVRQGKFFEIRLSPDLSPEQAKAEAEQIAGSVLANPVIEEYRVELME